MVRFIFRLQLLLLVLILKHSDADWNVKNELQEKTCHLDTDTIISWLTDLIHKEGETIYNCLSLKEQLKEKEKILKSNNETQKQLQTTIDDLKKTEETNNRTVQELREKLNECQAIIDGLENTEENPTEQIHTLQATLRNLNESEAVITDLKATNDGLKKVVETLNEEVERLCGLIHDVCGRLFVAVTSGDENSAKVLFNCSKNSCSSGTFSVYPPLIYAARIGKLAVVRVLLESGANVQGIDAYRWTALHNAAYFGHEEVCRLLLDWGAKLDPVDNSKYTSLHYAAQLGHLSVVKLLVERGADVKLKNVLGLTASEEARRFWKIEVAEWLNSYPAGK